MAKYVYPAIFERDEDFISVSFPDLPGCNSFGKDTAGAYEMAADALSLFLYQYEEDRKTIPSPSEPEQIHASKDAFISLVSCDTIVYRQRHDNKLVNKTVTIESWLNKLAVKAGLNCSKLLRDAIKRELGIW